MALVVRERIRKGRPAHAEQSGDWRAKLLPWLLPALIVAFWQIGASNGWIERRILPAPLDAVRAASDLLINQGLLGDIGVSLRRALSGLLVGGILGFAVGLLNGTLALSARLLDGSLQMLRTIPHLALLPLVIVWFGIGEEARLFLVSLGVFFPIYLNTYHGVRTVDDGLKEMGVVYGLSPWALFRQVIFPGALPSILLGLRYALGVMWLTLIVAESLSSNVGIGYITMNAREFMQTDVLVMGIVIYALLGKLSDSIAWALERRLLRWHPKYQNV